MGACYAVQRPMYGAQEEWPELPSVGDKNPHAVAEAVSVLNRVYEGRVFDSRYGVGGKLQACMDIATYGWKGGYGEIHPFSVALMLHTACARPCQHFYDLGSGTGKVVMLAKLLGLDATGVELLPDRWEMSCKALDRLRMETGVDCDTGIRFLHASALDTDISAANILFSSNITWPDELWDGVVRNATQQMQPGSVIISQKDITGPAFERVSDLRLVTNWDLDSKYFMHVTTGR